MKCPSCSAPLEAGAYRCEYCGEAIRDAPAQGAPAGQSGVAPGGGVRADSALRVRALASDGCWYTCNTQGQGYEGIRVRWDDGREAVLPSEMVREPCDPSRLQPGVRVFGEYHGKYYPGTVRQVADRQWNVQFDDGETAAMPRDRLHVCDRTRHPVAPGQLCLVQEGDGAWYQGRVLSGPDAQGRQRVRFDQGGDGVYTLEQINGPAAPDLARQGCRVMGIGEDGYFYPATVLQVQQGQAYLRFDDGDEAWLFAHQIRFIC
jgi:hypothetical protein